MLNKPVGLSWFICGSCVDICSLGCWYVETALVPPHKVRIFILKKYDVYTILPTDWNHYNVSTRHAFKCL